MDFDRTEPTRVVFSHTLANVGARNQQSKRVDFRVTNFHGSSEILSKSIDPRFESHRRALCYALDQEIYPHRSLRKSPDMTENDGWDLFSISSN